jgi:hypothetical protein
MGNLLPLPRRQRHRKYSCARKCLKPVLARLGWDARPGEADNDVLLRAAVLATLGEVDDTAVIGEARQRFGVYLAKPDTLSGSTRERVLCIVASNADATTWDQIHDLAKAASNGPCRPQ